MRGLGTEDDLPEAPDWKEYSPLDDDADTAIEHFLDTGEFDTDMIKAAVQTYAAAEATAGCAVIVGPAAPACGYLASAVAGYAYDIAEDVVGEIGSWFSKDPPPPILLEEIDIPDACVEMQWAWSYVAGIPAQGTLGIYHQMLDGLMLLKQQLGLPGAYDWPTVTDRFFHTYGVRLEPADTDDWYFARWTKRCPGGGTCGVDCAGSECVYHPTKPTGLGNVIWNDVPLDARVAPPGLNSDDTHRLCSYIGAFDDWTYTTTRCNACRNGWMRDWLANFVAAVAAETTWLHNLAQLYRAISQQQYQDALALQEAYMGAAADYYGLAAEYEASRPARNDAYLLLLVDFLGITDYVQGLPRSEVDAMVADALVARGMSVELVLRWIVYCDPPLPPGWDPVECFKAGIESWREQYPAPSGGAFTPGSEYARQFNRKPWISMVALAAAGGAAWWLWRRRRA